MAALRTHGDFSDKPLIQDHLVVEQLAGANPAGPGPIDAAGSRLAMAVCFVAGCMLALVATRAVAPASANCSPPPAEVTHVAP